MRQKRLLPEMMAGRRVTECNKDTYQESGQPGANGRNVRLAPASRLAGQRANVDRIDAGEKLRFCPLPLYGECERDGQRRERR